jgi:coronin-1B/1C/6
MHSDRIDWNRTLFKTYYEKRSFGHLLINFSYILVLWHPAAQHVLASIVGEHTVKLWDMGTPKSPCAVLTGHGDRIQRLDGTITCNNLPQLQLCLFDPHTGGEATRITEGRVASRAQMWSGSETGRIATTGFLESSKEV